MNKISFWAFFILLLISFSGCSLLKQTFFVSYEKTSSGLKYRILEEGDGKRPANGDLLAIHYIAKLKEDGYIIDNTYERDEPLTFRIGKGHVIKGWEEGIPLMSQGGKAEFIIPPELAYGDRSFDKIPSNSTIVFEIELLDITKPKDTFEPDPEVYESTPDGVKYYVKESGDGKRVEDGSLVRVKYRGYFEDGEEFDRSDGEHFEFLVGEGMVIKGWDLVFRYLREGDKATLWIPFELAYGEYGRGSIPPNTNIMFDIEILEVKKPIQPEPFNTTNKDTIETKSGLKYIIVEKGNNIEPEQGDIVKIHYTGYCVNGDVFDSSVKRGQPLKFVVGSQQVITGLDKAIRYMEKGSKARIIIPPNLSNKSKKIKEIPPSSYLIFDVELIDITK